MLDDQNTLVVGRAAQFLEARTRREFMRVAAMGGAIVLLPSLFAACDDDDDITSPGGPPVSSVTLDLRTDQGILNFLFLLEQTESTFYNVAVASNAFGGMTAEQREVIGDIRAVENIHREFIRSLLGTASVGNLAFNTTNLNAAAATGASILHAAEMLEDAGAAVQIGISKYIQNADLLSIAGKVNSVEARHVAAIRDIREQAGLAPSAGGTRFAGDDIVVPSGPLAGLNAKVEPAVGLAALLSTGFPSTTVTIGNPPPTKPGTPDFAPPMPTP
jgi:hypothetical protein